MNINKDLKEAIKILNSIDETFTVDNVITHFLEFIKSSNENELEIYGNQAGLIYFAKSILEIALRNTEGVHKHFEITGIVDRCDMNIVVSFKSAEWDKR